ncbi:hypothetical protein ACFL1R_04215, partial [Candidatus Latescibacterota bacterium]
MDALENAMKNSNTEEMKRRLFTALVDLLAVSENQEKLLENIDLAEYSGTESVKKDILAQRELEIIDALSKAGRSLLRFSELVIELSGLFDQIVASIEMYMQEAVDAFATGNAAAGVSHARNAQRSMNNAIHFLTTIIQSSQGAGSQAMPGDLMQQLQQIANGELSLQMQMGTPESEQLMMQLAAEQQKLAEMLSNLSEKLSEDQRLREMLEKLVENMDDTADMMRRNESREFIERMQLDIYRRLLDARRSRREKEETKERKSWTAKRDVSIGADKMPDDLGEKRQDINERIKQAMEDDFNPEYLRLIRRYFESLLHDSN